jgi:ABC-type Fe3+-hydroxamate transport system substrate-binding protein
MKARQIVMFFVSATLMACGSGESTSTSSNILSPGKSITLAKGQSIEVPSGTTIYSTPNGASLTIIGDHDVVNVSAGSIASAPTSATGPADNTLNGI